MYSDLSWIPWEQISGGYEHCMKLACDAMMVYDDLIYDDLWWFMMIYNDLSWFIMIYDDCYGN